MIASKDHNAKTSVSVIKINEEKQITEANGARTSASYHRYQTYRLRH